MLEDMKNKKQQYYIILDDKTTLSKAKTTSIQKNNEKSLKFKQIIVFNIFFYISFKITHHYDPLHFCRG